MVSVGFGTQTGGSVLRPSSFCGIVGFKPSYGAVNRAGLKFAAESLDTIGLMARSVDDVALTFDVLVGRRPAPLPAPAGTPRIGLCRTPLWETAQPETVASVESAVRRLADAGAGLEETPVPAGFDALSAARDVFNDYERARATAYEWNSHRERISARLRGSIQRGLALDHERYVAAVATAAACRAKLGGLFARSDILLAPCVPGEAPEGLGSTGDPKMQGLWTILHVPTITLPTHTGPKGLPVGIQLVGPPGGDVRLLAAARWVWDRLTE
jgi:amidase